jgi:hypothetical protein
MLHQRGTWSIRLAKLPLEIYAAFEIHFISSLPAKRDPWKLGAAELKKRYR